MAVNERDDSAGAVAGRNAVLEALRSGRAVNKLQYAEGARGLGELLALARELRVPTESVPQSHRQAWSALKQNQGVVAQVAPIEYAALDGLLRADDSPLLVLLDGVEDPHNLGAIIRTAEALGVTGVVLPRRRSCAVNATVAKTSAGAVMHVSVARVGNVAQTLELAKERGFWVVGADMGGEVSVDRLATALDVNAPLLVVIGGEGKGLARLTRARCDVVASIPMRGRVNSLNASVAAAIVLYEVVRQRGEALA